MRKVLYLAISLSLLLSGAFRVLPAAAQSTPDPAFNMNHLISDDDFTDYNSMSVERIQAFLDGQSGILKTYSVKQSDGTSKSAARLIFEAAQNYHISPKVILVTLQKEEGLITLTNPSQVRLDYAMGYGCPDGGYQGSPCNAARAGFDKQLDLATWQFGRYLTQIATNGYTIAYWGPGISKTMTCIDSDAVRGLCVSGKTYVLNPSNASTAALYTYTPHVGGNYSFWALWNNFGFNVHRLYPDGSLLRAKGKSTVYLIDQGLKRPFASAAAFVSRYSFSKVIEVSPDQLFLYDDGAPIKFANYSLLQTPNKGIYLLVDTKIRPITSGAAFKAAGFTRDEVIKVTWADVAPYSTGDKITTDNIYPSGQLLQNKKTGGIYFVQDGIRHLVPTKDIYKNQFGLRKPIPTASATIDAYPKGTWVAFKDGELITSKKGGTAYFISHGQRLPIASWAAAVAYHFDRIWGNLIKTDDASINSMPLGPTLDVDGLVQIAGQP